MCGKFGLRSHIAFTFCYWNVTNRLKFSSVDRFGPKLVSCRGFRKVGRLLSFTIARGYEDSVTSLGISSSSFRGLSSAVGVTRSTSTNPFAVVNLSCKRLHWRSSQTPEYLKLHVLQPYNNCSQSDYTEVKMNVSKTYKKKDEWHLRLVWVDLEMTGLDIEKDVIIEMACIITDKDLNVIAESPDIVIHQENSILDNMNEWCKEHHGKSGLTKAVKESTITLEEAEHMMLKFIEEHVPKGKCPLAGNSVHADKKFLDKYMPTFMNHLHYRIVDVSSIKELVRRWYPDSHSMSWKSSRHRAKEDIQDSIEELRRYKSSIFK